MDINTFAVCATETGSEYCVFGLHHICSCPVVPYTFSNYPFCKNAMENVLSLSSGRKILHILTTVFMQNITRSNYTYT